MWMLFWYWLTSCTVNQGKRKQVQSHKSFFSEDEYISDLQLLYPFRTIKANMHVQFQGQSFRVQTHQTDGQHMTLVVFVVHLAQNQRQFLCVVTHPAEHVKSAVEPSHFDVQHSESECMKRENANNESTQMTSKCTQRGFVSCFSLICHDINAASSQFALSLVSTDCRYLPVQSYSLLHRLSAIFFALCSSASFWSLRRRW